MITCFELLELLAFSFKTSVFSKLSTISMPYFYSQNLLLKRANFMYTETRILVYDSEICGQNENVSG